VWCGKHAVNTILSVSADKKLLDEIKSGYKEDNYCLKLPSIEKSFGQLREINRLWYVGNRLVVPRTGMIREDLFWLAHDTLGHFGADKSYAALKDAYYWPGMR
jgi:hypothetical protein